MEVKRIANIVLPTLSFKEREYAYVRVLSEMRRPRDEDAADDGREPATLCRVIDLETGTECDLICPRLLVSAWRRMDEPYVGRCFEINVPKERRPGKDYKDCHVYMIEDPGAGESRGQTASAPAASAGGSATGDAGKAQSSAAASGAPDKKGGRR